MTAKVIVYSELFLNLVLSNILSRSRYVNQRIFMINPFYARTFLDLVAVSLQFESPEITDQRLRKIISFSENLSSSTGDAFVFTSSVRRRISFKLFQAHSGGTLA